MKKVYKVVACLCIAKGLQTSLRCIDKADKQAYNLSMR